MELENQNKEVETPNTEVETPQEKDTNDSEKLLRALESERQNAKQKEKELKEQLKKQSELEEKLRKLEQIDPDKYQKLIEKERAREEEALIKKNEFEELKKRYSEREQQAIKEAQNARNTLADYTIKTSIEKAFYENNGKRGSSIDNDIAPIDAVMQIVRPKVAIVDDRIVVVDSSGQPELNGEGKPKTVYEKMLELKSGKTLGSFFQSDEDLPRGGGMSGSFGSGKSAPAYTRDQARLGKASIDDIASGKAFVQ
jgi:HD-GYP domain-containing protein (c-di-GMP phosphodiesterase class II)